MNSRRKVARGNKGLVSFCFIVGGKSELLKKKNWAKVCNSRKKSENCMFFSFEIRRVSSIISNQIMAS